MVPELTGTAGEPVIFNLREIEHANIQSSQVKMNMSQKILVLIKLGIGMVEVLKPRRFFLLFFFSFIRVRNIAKCDCQLFSTIQINASKTACVLNFFKIVADV